MKNRQSPIAYPTTGENARLWGFDIIEPVGTPMAWVHDWTSAQAGWNRPMQGMMDLGELLGSMGSDLSTLKVDDVMAAFCLMYRKDIFGLIEEIETAVDRETAMKIARSYGIKAGSLGWTEFPGSTRQAPAPGQDRAVPGPRPYLVRTQHAAQYLVRRRESRVLQDRLQLRPYRRET